MEFSHNTLDDKIIRDGLSAVATLSDYPQSHDQYFIVGGMATQSYLPTSCRRPTSDIDLAILKPLNRENFHSFTRSIYDFLRSSGYEIQERKARRAFCIDYEDKSSGKSAFISVPRHNEISYQRSKDILERERDHARTKIVEGTVDTYFVASPEDIIVRKLSRALNRLCRNPNFEQYVSSMKDLSNEDIQSRLQQFKELRNDVFKQHSSPEKTEEFLRFLSDLYDIRLLSELSGVNKKYFDVAFNSWDSLKPDFSNDPDKRIWKLGLIARSTLPDYLINHG